MRPDPRDFMMYVVPILLAAMMLVAGCTPDSARWTAAEAPKTVKVDFVAMAHEVHFAPGATALAPAEAKALADFLDKVALAYGDQVTVDAGPVVGTGSADAISAKRIEAVTVALRKLRVRAQPAARPTVDGALARDGVVVTVGRYIATGPRCPDFSKPEADDFANTTGSNYGCATATNLGLMVANPGDLVHGTPAGPADADFGARGVQRYRSGALSTSLTSELSKGTGGSSGGGN